jgi:VIT1/CCC1 family predicted Fe2+/Mn2+ transporter
LADYVYGTVSSLVAVAGISFDPTIDVVTAVAIVLVGAVAIWWAHALSRLVNRRAQEHLELTPGDVGRELRGAISVVVAALPAAAVLALVGTGIWTMRTGLILANVLGVVSLLAVGIGTAGGSDRPLGRRVRYVVAVVLVGVVIVVLETAVHLV